MSDADHAAYGACLAMAKPQANKEDSFEAWSTASAARLVEHGNALDAGLKAKLKTWWQQRGGRMSLTLDLHTGRLRRATGSLSAPLAGDPAAVKAAAVQATLPTLSNACQTTPTEWSEERAGWLPDERGRHLRLRRKACGGLDVVRDKIDLVWTKDPHNTGSWRVTHASVRCSGPAPSVCTPTISKAAASTTAAGSFAATEQATSSKTELVLYPHEGDVRLAWRAWVGKPADDRVVFVDAQAGTVLHSYGRRHHAGSHTGTLKMKVRKPWQSGQVDGGMCFANIYQNDPTTTLLGTTGGDGAYSSPAAAMAATTPGRRR